MAFPTVPVLIGGGLAAVIGLLWFTRNASAAEIKNKKPAEAPPPKSDNPADYAAGFKDGTADGTADGKVGVKNARPMLNYSADPVRQKNFEMGYFDGYGAAYDAASAAAGLSGLGDLFTKDAVPPTESKEGPTGGAKGGGTTTTKDAVDWYNIGFATGKKNGEFDGKNAAMGKGSFGATPRPAPPTDDPIPRDRWSLGYERGYQNGFDMGQSSVKTGAWDYNQHPVSAPTHGVATVGEWGRRGWTLANMARRRTPLMDPIQYGSDGEQVR